MESPIQDGKRKRAQKACQFCHQRKMKCNNQLPTCSNCITHHQACTYAQGPKKPRPSNDRISRLEEENRQLHAHLADDATIHRQGEQRSARATRSSTRRVSAQDNAHPIAASRTTDVVSIADEDPSPGPMRADALRNVEFHGPSSVLFDEGGPNIGNIEDPNASEHSLEPPSAELMANAATQRQLESIHFSTHRLDTDGVEQRFAEELLSLFWKTANSAFLVVYRPAFMRDWACGGPYYSKLLLNAIYHNSSRHACEDSIHRYGPNGDTLSARFQQRFKELLRDAFDYSTTTTVQALLVMSASLSALSSGRSVAWLYSGMAYRMIIDLGLHTNRPHSSMSKRASDEENEIQRRVFWSAFVIDKLQSFYHGRPAHIQEADTSVRLTFRDHYDELEQWAPMEPSHVILGSYSPSYCVSNFSRLCRLSLIMNKVLNEIYGERKSVEKPSVLLQSLTRLNHDLDEWQNTVPLHLKFSPGSIGSNTAPAPAPHTYAATIMYYVLQILLHRPFVSEGHLQSALPTVALESFSSCVGAADSIAQYLDSYNRAHTLRKLPYFLFYASYVSATIHVRIAAQKQLETNAYAYLDTCFQIFDQNMERNSATTKAKAVIQQLMNRMGVNLPSEGPLQSASADAQNDPVSHSTRTTPKAYQDRGWQGDRELDADLGISQPPDWDFGDLDFDAVLQSFNQPSKASGSSHDPQSAMVSGSQQPNEAFNGPEGIPGQSNVSNTAGESLGQDFENDLLFGFNFSDTRDS